MKSPVNIKPEDIAMDTVRAYFSNDLFAKHAGIELLEVSPGYAKAKMELREYHKNAYNTAHGGALFTLADFVFAAAANACGIVSVAVNVSMSFIKAVSTGTVVAVAQEVSSTNKLGVYRIEVTDEENEVVAVMQGMVYRKKEKITDFIFHRDHEQDAQV